MKNATASLTVHILIPNQYRGEGYSSDHLRDLQAKLCNVAGTYVMVGGSREEYRYEVQVSADGLKKLEAAIAAFAAAIGVDEIQIITYENEQRRAVRAHENVIRFPRR